MHALTFITCATFLPIKREHFDSQELMAYRHVEHKEHLKYHGMNSKKSSSQKDIKRLTNDGPTDHLLLVLGNQSKSPQDSFFFNVIPGKLHFTFSSQRALVLFACRLAGYVRIRLDVTRLYLNDIQKWRQVCIFAAYQAHHGMNCGQAHISRYFFVIKCP